MIGLSPGEDLPVLVLDGYGMEGRIIGLIFLGDGMCWLEATRWRTRSLLSPYKQQKCGWGGIFGPPPVP